MKIKDALLKELGIKLSSSSGRWLVIDELYVRGGEFVVYDRRPYAKRTEEVYRGTDEEEAVKALLNEEQS